MTAARSTALDYIRFLLATPEIVSATEAARVQPERLDRPAHDSFTRLLQRLEPDAATLWTEVQPLVNRTSGVLVLDDTTLDKPYAFKIDLVARHWSGKHHAVVNGINLLTLLWTDGDRSYPCDYRIYDPTADVTKHEHFQALLKVAQARGFQPKCVAFDTWYSSLENLKAVRNCGWIFLTRLKSNRQVSPQIGQTMNVSAAEIAATGTVVHLRGFGLIKVFRIVASNGDTQHWCTNDLEMETLVRVQFAEYSWSIEEYHRGLKQHTGVERCQARSADAQRVHIGCAIRAFIRLEYHRFTTGVTWFEAKLQIIRNAVQAALLKPLYELPTA